MSTVQAVKVQDMINTELYAELSGVVSGSLEAELEIFNSMVALMPASLSVRGAQATIAKVEADCGSLPSIKSSHTQEFINTSILRALKGGEKSTLLVAVNICVQGRKKMNAKPFGAMLKEEGMTFAKVQDTIAKAPAKPKQERATTPKGVDGLLVALAEALEAEDFDGLVSNPAQALAVAKQLNACASLSVKIAS